MNKVAQAAAQNSTLAQHAHRKDKTAIAASCTDTYGRLEQYETCHRHPRRQPRPVAAANWVLFPARYLILRPG